MAALLPVEEYYELLSEEVEYLIPENILTDFIFYCMLSIEYTR